jgi:hypothetical protein
LESARREVGYEQWGRASEHKRLRTLIARIKKEVESASATLRALEREAEREAQLWARSDADRALLACAKATDRNRAAMLKRQIENSDIGPYCGDDLWPKRHLDHIFPIRQGGLSVTSNLVYVCAPCNLRKADLTLNEFIDVSELNREEVFRRLKALRKRY